MGFSRHGWSWTPRSPARYMAAQGVLGADRQLFTSRRRRRGGRRPEHDACSASAILCGDADRRCDRRHAGADPGQPVALRYALLAGSGDADPGTGAVLLLLRSRQYATRLSERLAPLDRVDADRAGQGGAGPAVLRLSAPCDRRRLAPAGRLWRGAGCGHRARPAHADRHPVVARVPGGGRSIMSC